MSANWHVTLTPAGKPKVADEHGFSICTLSGRPYKEMVKDAHKISAAPELLKFAEWAMGQLCGDSGTGESHWEQFKEFRDGQSAIAKAEGKQ